jgi:hypothetical protein
MKSLPGKKESALSTKMKVLIVKTSGRFIAGSVSNKIITQINCAVKIAQCASKNRYSKSKQTYSSANNNSGRIFMPRRLSITSIIAVFFALIFTASTQAQAVEFWAFLGECDMNQTVQQTSMYNISYKANGFDRARKNRVRKTIAQMEARGASHLISGFEEFARQMTKENAIPRWIDEAYARTVIRWLSVGDYRLPGAKLTCAEVAQRFNPSSLLINVEEVPFQVQGYGPNFYAAGTTDGHLIRVLNVNAEGFLSDPQHANLRRFDSLVEWEIGNSFALFAGYQAPSINQEVGFKVPGVW